tara:strand:- start:4046 stop:4948 length:903 start_codon:yes stop_codon:yes gene_type:complete
MKRLTSILLFALFLQASIAQEALQTEAGSPQVSYRNGTIAEGTDWETRFYISDSGKPGPTVLIIGGMHGNEPAGSRAAEQILHWPIVSGKLVVVPRANVLALAANKRLIPGQPRGSGDLNRNFPQSHTSSATEVSPRGQPAAALWGFATKVQPDWVLDLHEGYEFHRSHKPPDGKKKSVGSSIIYRGGPELDPLAKRVVAAADATVTDPAKRFSLLRRGPVDSGLARACINVMGAEAVILETTFKDQPMALRTRQHRAMANVILNHIGLINSDCTDHQDQDLKSGIEPIMLQPEITPRFP